MLDWLDRVRQAAGSADQEYALVPTIATSAASQLIDFKQKHGWTPDRRPLPPGVLPFPEYYVGAREDFGKTLTEFNEDLWNAAEREYLEPWVDMCRGLILLPLRLPEHIFPPPRLD
jgi:hypothetical protein